MLDGMGGNSLPPPHTTPQPHWPPRMHGVLSPQMSLSHGPRAFFICSLCIRLSPTKAAMGSEPAVTTTAQQRGAH